VLNYNHSLDSQWKIGTYSNFILLIGLSFLNMHCHIIVNSKLSCCYTQSGLNVIKLLSISFVLVPAKQPIGILYSVVVYAVFWLDDFRVWLQFSYFSFRTVWPELMVIKPLPLNTIFLCVPEKHFVYAYSKKLAIGILHPIYKVLWLDDWVWVWTSYLNLFLWDHWTSPHDEHQSSGSRPVKLCSDQYI